MFALQNPEYELSPAYLKCVGEKMDSLKPFGVIPHTLTKNIRQAFVAARTFVQGLAVGRNVALKIAEVCYMNTMMNMYSKIIYFILYRRTHPFVFFTLSVAVSYYNYRQARNKAGSTSV